MGWYRQQRIVKNWIKDDAVYDHPHGPFNTMTEAQAYAKKPRFDCQRNSNLPQKISDYHGSIRIFK